VDLVNNAGFATYMMDLALNHVNEERSKIGAQLNRLESVITNNNTSVESTVASRSRIQDADYAQETTTLTKTQIMQQAANVDGAAQVSQSRSRFLIPFLSCCF